MINLRGYTKQQKFGLLTLATKKTWEKFEVDLLYNKSTLENTDVVVDGYGFNLILWRDRGNKPLCQYFITRDSQGFITLVLTTYKRGSKSNKHKEVHYIKSMSDCERAATTLTELELNELIKALPQTLSEHTVWQETFKGILTHLVSETPKVQGVRKRTPQGDSLQREVRHAFMRLSDMFKAFQQYNKGGLVHGTDTKYGLILSDRELTLELFDANHNLFLGFRVVPTDSDNYDFTHWNSNLPKPIEFQDVSVFYEYAELLASSLTGGLAMDFLVGLEDCLTACGLWSVYNRAGVDLY